MATRIYLTVLVFFTLLNLDAQQFITKAVIEYEVKSNIQKTMGNNVFDEMIKDNLPTFKTGYYALTFSDNKSIYKFDRWDEKDKIPEFLRRSDEENIWYFDYNSGKLNIKKNIWGADFVVRDSIPELEWRLTNENRIIAGFNCRKAVTKIFDSVYVFAFYTDEIIIPGGPCSIHGLPGMILGVTIPRLYTSWIATKVMVNNVQEDIIKPVPSKKDYSLKLFRTTLDEHVKDWTTDDKEQDQQKNRFIWSTLL